VECVVEILEEVDGAEIWLVAMAGINMMGNASWNIPTISRLRDVTRPSMSDYQPYIIVRPAIVGMLYRVEWTSHVRGRTKFAMGLLYTNFTP